MENIIKRVALAQGISEEECRQEMQTFIDATWDQPEGAEERAELFPEGKPSPELFIQRISAIIKAEMSDKRQTM